MTQQSRLSATPTIEEFDPVIDFQSKVIDLIYHHHDYSQGLPEILLSGSVGSAKSILMAHLGVRHCIENSAAVCLLGRKALPDLKDTIYKKITEHLRSMKENADYKKWDNTARVWFRNRSEMIARTWHDQNFSKFRSMDISAALIEELTENNKKYSQAYTEISLRINRLPHVKHPFMISATNPDAPSHWAYDHFGIGLPPHARPKNRYVFFSLTADNPFLPPEYITQLKENLDPRMARRMLYGEWIELAKDVIYYAYTQENNRIDKDWEIIKTLPVHVSWDFNIGEGKPMSVVLLQYLPGDDTFHIFDQVIVEGMRTEDSCEELADRGLLDHPVKYIINGDATGKHRDTRNKKSDYGIIKKFFSNYRTKSGEPLDFEVSVPSANPPLRTRHNTVNAYCENENGRHRLFVHCPRAETVDKGLRLSKLKTGGSYIEDDNDPWQHCTTALGYAIVRIVKKAKQIKPEARQL